MQRLSEVSQIFDVLHNSDLEITEYAALCQNKQEKKETKINKTLSHMTFNNSQVKCCL